jgi:hypothetical protein
MGGITFMPFVRGARGGEGSQYDTATKKPTKGPSQPAPKAAKTEKAAPKKEEVKKAAPQTETGPGADVAAAIVAAGDKVRDLKAAKADKAEIKAKVDELLALKAKYQEVTGKAYAPGSAPAPKAAKTEKARRKKLRRHQSCLLLPPRRLALLPHPVCGRQAKWTQRCLRPDSRCSVMLVDMHLLPRTARSWMPLEGKDFKAVV